MGKFKDENDQNWQPVASRIVDLVLLTTKSNPTPSSEC